MIDWDRYITEVHLPSVVAHGRARSSPSKRSATARTDQVTLLEEEKISAYYGAGTLYATPQRQEPLV